MNTCYKYNVIQDFLRFRVTDKTLKDSLTCSRCQQLLLSKKIRYKKKRSRQSNLFKVDLPSIKARLQDTAFRSYSAFNKDNSSSFNLSKDEFELLCKLKNENNLVIQKADKGNTIVIIRTLI